MYGSRRTTGLRPAVVAGVIAGLAVGLIGCTSGGRSSTGGTHSSPRSGSSAGAGAGTGNGTAAGSTDAPNGGSSLPGVAVSNATIAVAASGRQARLAFTITNNSAKKLSLMGASANNFALAQLGRASGGKIEPLPKGGIPLPHGQSISVDGTDYVVTLRVPIKSANKGDSVLIQLNFDDGSVATARAVIDAHIAKI